MPTIKSLATHTAGLGFRREMLPVLQQQLQRDGDVVSGIDFFEIAPENWIGVGGRFAKQLRQFTERQPFLCHGLSLSLGSTDPLDTQLLGDIKQFIKQHSIRGYSEHLSYCSDRGHLYDLLPIPFTSEAVEHVAGRIRQVQDVLEQRIAIENVSYYLAPSQELSELEFINAVLQEADCDLLLDVNNIYVNSINHGYDAMDFLHGIAGQRTAYYHVAGHFDEADDLKVDTHGAAVIDPVWHLLAEAYRLYGVKPTLLERDFNVPPLNVMLDELAMVRQLQAPYEVNRFRNRVVV